MNKISTSIYFNPTFGYIVASYTKYINGGPDRIMNPVLHIQPLADCKYIGNSILQGLENTRVAERVTQESLQGFKFWQISGIKSFSTFSKKFRLVDIDKDDDGFKFSERKRDLKGAYTYSKDDITIKLPLKSIDKSIGETVLQILSNEIVNIDDLTMTFTTVHDSTIKYKRPTDDFEDIGDGHTDAYQIYTYENNDKNYITFLIDNGYSDFTESKIKQRWQQMYGILIEFDFKVINDTPERIRVNGKTNSEMIFSRIYQDGDGELEVLYKIDLLNTSEKERMMIKEEFEKTISSIKIS